MAKLSIRIDFANDQRIGPGKVQLLERIAATGSIAAAGRALGMSYRRAWMLVDELNGMFDQPVVLSQVGGARGGNARLTRLGKAIVTNYRAMERVAAAAAKGHLSALKSQMKKKP